MDYRSTCNRDNTAAAVKIAQSRQRGRIAAQLSVPRWSSKVVAWKMRDRAVWQWKILACVTIGILVYIPNTFENIQYVYIRTAIQHGFSATRRLGAPSVAGRS